MEKKIPIIILILVLVSFIYYGLVNNSQSSANKESVLGQYSTNQESASFNNEAAPVQDTAEQPVSEAAPANSNNLESDIMQFEKAEQVLQDGKNYKAILKTSKGNITVDLAESETPITVNNFVFLAKQGFYNNVIFHRIIDGFMIQGGDPTGTGAGGPGYRFDDEPFEGEYTKGTIAMANAGPNTNGSQFFIMHADYPLPKNYVIFGNVTEGLDVVDAIATSEVKMSPSGENSQPVEPAVIESVEIIEE